MNALFTARGGSPRPQGTRLRDSCGRALAGESCRTDLLPGLAGDLAGQQRRWHEKPNVILGRSDGGREIFTITAARAFAIGSELRFFANRVTVGQHLPNIEDASLKAPAG